MKVWQCYKEDAESSINTLDELIKVLQDVRNKYGNCNLGNDGHWSMELDVLPSGCLMGTTKDGKNALDIECKFES